MEGISGRLFRGDRAHVNEGRALVHHPRGSQVVPQLGGEPAAHRDAHRHGSEVPGAGRPCGHHDHLIVGQIELLGDPDHRTARSAAGDRRSPASTRSRRNPSVRATLGARDVAPRRSGSRRDRIPGSAERRVGEQARRLGRDATAMKRAVHPVADLQRTRPDARHQAAATDVLTGVAQRDRVVGCGVAAELRDRRARGSSSPTGRSAATAPRASTREDVSRLAAMAAFTAALSLSR